MLQMLMDLIYRGRNYLIGAAVIAALFVGGKWWYDTEITKSYNAGFAASDSKWMKLSDDNSAKNAQTYIDNIMLNQKLKATQDQLVALKSQKEAKVQQEVQEFQKSTDASRTLSNGFISIYNNSLGE